MNVSDMGKLIGKYLRETQNIDPSLTDDEIGEKAFNSTPGGEFFYFYDLYKEAETYYKLKGVE